MVWQHSGQASAASWAQRMQVEGRHGGGAGGQAEALQNMPCHADAEQAGPAAWPAPPRRAAPGELLPAAPSGLWWIPQLPP